MLSAMPGSGHRRKDAPLYFGQKNLRTQRSKKGALCMKKSRKHILVQSLIAMILCVSMLAGATFAWFTDVEVNGNNIIATGTLNVELYHTSAVVADEAVTETTQLFLDDEGKSILWEPGVVSWENLRIANVGNLALSYKFAMTTANENFIIDGENQYGLSQALKIGVVPGGISDTSSREAVLAEVTEWKPLASFSDVGWLKPADEASAEDETSFGIVVYWEPGEDDNRWNLNNGKVLNQGDVLSIDLGIELLASQQPYEVDAFDKDYDFDASYFFEGVSQESSNVTTENGQVSEGATIGKADSNVSAQVSAGTKVNTDELVLTVKKLEESTGNVQVEADQVVNSVDVHVDGLAADNTVPVLVTVKEMMAAGMNVGNYTLYHMENGVAVPMTYVSGTPANHNEYTYDPGTGNVTMALASFSEIMVVSDNINIWLGIIDTAFNGGDGTKDNPFIIANADQLALLSKLVSKDEKTLDAYHKAHGTQPEEFFNKAYYKLHADIDFGGEDNVYDVDKTKGELDDIHCFYPIGSWKELKVDEVTNEPIYGYGGDFKGHFDGNGNIIRNLYQNTWQMSGTYNDGYAAHSNHWKTAMGVFGDVYDGTIENLCIDNFQSDGEFTPTGCVVAYAGGNSRFEDIIILNSNPRVYNTANGGVVGINYNSSAPGAEDHLIFKDITVDSSNKISALWGSYDVSCGGILGRIRENSAHKPVHGNTSVSSGFNTATFENCNVSAILDVYNDCCANYQYYQYRYSGMLIGTCDYIGDVPEVGYEDVVTATNCTVTYGPWNEYWYCELVANSLASYTHDHQFSRLEKVAKIENGMVYPLKGAPYAIPTEGRYNYVVVNGENKDENGTCYHYVNGAVWNHADAGEESVGGKTILKEDRQHYFLPFNQLFTGYGWGSSPVRELQGVTILTNANEVAKDKFLPKTNLAPEYPTGTTFKLSDLFTGNGDITDANVEVFLSPVGKSTATASVTYDSNNWENTTLQISGIGVLKVTVADYYNCKMASTYINIITDEHLAHCVGHGVGASEDGHDKKLYGWQPWDGKSNIYESGNYYLTQDVVDNQQRQLGALRVNANNKENFNVEINLCLNGHSIEANSRVFGLGYGVKVNLMNCGGKENKAVTLTGNGIRSDGWTNAKDYAQAGVILQQGESTLDIYNNIELKLAENPICVPRSGGIIESAYGSKITLHHSVTLSGGYVEQNTVQEKPTGGSGGSVYLGENAVLTLNDNATIKGGTCTVVGGNIYLAGNNAKVVLNGGQILDGQAESGGNIYAGSGTLVELKSGAISGGKTTAGTGGNICLNGNEQNFATLTAIGGIIENGVSNGGHGGNIYVGLGTANLANVTVQNGVANHKVANPNPDDANQDNDLDKNGGNIFVGGNNNTALTIGQGAKLLGGEADRGGNIFVYCGNLTIQGNAEVTGGKANNLGFGRGSDCVHLNAYTDNGKWRRNVTLAGAPTITDLRVSNDVSAKDTCDTVNISGLTGGKIGISHDKAIVALGENKSCHVAFATGGAGKLGYFTNSNPNLSMEDANGVLYMNYHGAHCICGGDWNHTHFNISGEWKPWDGHSDIAEGGNYYLTQDITESTQYWMGGAHTNTKVMTINLCLNGHSIASKNRVFAIAPYVTFNLMNCGEQAVLTGKGDAGNGGVIRVHSGSSVMSVYGNIEIKALPGAATTLGRGGAIANYGTLNLYGTVVRGTELATFTANNTTYGGYGAAIYTENGTVTLNNAVIYGAKCDDVNDQGDVAATYRGFGGAIYATGGSMTINGGTIYGSEVIGDGGAIYLNQAKLTINSGTTIYSGKASWLGGAIAARNSSTIVMNGGTIDGKNPVYSITGSHAIYGGGVLIEGSSFTMNGGTIQNFTAGKGAGICVNNGTASATISGNATITNCTSTSDGAAIHNSGTLDIKGGTITTNHANGNGGSIATGAGTVTLSGGTITNGTANGTAGNIYVYGGTFNMTAGTVENGKTIGTGDQHGGNIYVTNSTATANITGGTVQNGDAAKNGGNLGMSSSAKVTIGGTAKFLNGTCGNVGGNVWIHGGTLTVSGSANITGGNSRTSTIPTASVYINNTAYTNGAVLKLVGTPQISYLYEWDNSTTASIIDISGMTAGAKISAYNANFSGRVTSNTGVTEAQMACFTSALSNYAFSIDGGRLVWNKVSG